MTSEPLMKAILVFTIIFVIFILYKATLNAGNADGKGAQIQRAPQAALNGGSYAAVNPDLTMPASAVIGCSRGFSSLQGCNQTIFDMAWVVGKGKVVADSMRRVEYCRDTNTKPCEAVLYDTAVQTSVRVSRRIMWIDRSAYLDGATLKQHAAYIARQPNTRGDAAQVSEVAGTRVYFVVL